MSSHIETAQTKSTSLSNIQFLTTTAVFIVLVYVFTAIINIRLPISINGGLIHLGNVPLFIGAIIFGKKTGMLAGGIGMAMFDLLSPYAIWAPFTLVIVGLMGLVVGLITENHKSIPWFIVAMVAACAIKVVGYYIAEVILYHNWVVPLTSVPGNLVQIGVAAVITLIIIEPLRIAADKTILRNH